MNCKKCGQTIDKGAVICVNCGCKVRKPVYKKWWCWVLMSLATLMTIGIISPSDTDADNSNNGTTSQIVQSQDNVQAEIKYEKVELRQMMDDLDANALKAEKKYQNKYVEVVGKITNFDSDGSYIGIEPVNADAWNFDTVMCKISNDNQRNFLMEKEVDDIVTIKGQITSIGEVLGYTIKMAEVS